MLTNQNPIGINIQKNVREAIQKTEDMGNKETIKKEIKIKSLYQTLTQIKEDNEK